MDDFLNKLTIKTKIRLNSAVLVSLMLLSFLIAVTAMGKIGNELEGISQQDIPLAQSLTAITEHQLEQAIHFERSLRFGNLLLVEDIAAAHFKQEKETFKSISHQVNQEIKDTEQQLLEAIDNAHSKLDKKEYLHIEENLKLIEKHHRQYEQHAEQVFILLEKDLLQEAEAIAQQVEHEEEKLGKELQDLLLEINEFTLHAAQQATAHEHMAVIWLSVFFILALAISFFMSRTISRSIINPMTNMAKLMAEMESDCSFSKRIPIENKDETAVLARSFNALMEKVQYAVDEINATMAQLAAGDTDSRITAHLSGDLNQIKMATNGLLDNISAADEKRLQIEKQRQQQEKSEKSVARENNRVKQALDSVSTATLIADNYYQVIYLNEAMQTLFRKQEQALAADISGFDANAVQGSDISQFIDDLSILQDLSTTEKIGLKIGGMTAQLSLSPIFDDRKKRIGTVLEWEDRTEEIAIENEIDELVAGASDGDLTLRIDMRGKSGFSEKLAAGLNSLISVVDGAVNETTQMLNAMAAGDLSTRINGDYRGSFAEIKHSANGTVEKLNSVMDEINVLVNAANRGELSERIAMQGKSGFFASLSQGLNELVHVVDIAINETSTMLQTMAKGDLTQKISGNYKGSFEVIKNSANSTADNLVDIINKLNTIAENVSNGAQEVASGNLDMSQRTEEQAAALEQTNSTLQGMTDEVKRSADSAEQANEFSDIASRKASSGGAVVNQAIEAMAAINASSRQISDIISVIDEIAFQTNLLALNAAVEAARAGEQGRGFAVVAGEVRNLAGRSATAAKEIKDLILSSQHNVDEGSKRVNESGVVLAEIVSAVENVSSSIQDVARRSQQQNTSIQEVNLAIEQLDTMTQQNAALVEQVSAASESMSEHAKDVYQTLGFFKT